MRKTSTYILLLFLILLLVGCGKNEDFIPNDNMHIIPSLPTEEMSDSMVIPSFPTDPISSIPSYPIPSIPNDSTVIIDDNQFDIFNSPFGYASLGVTPRNKDSTYIQVNNEIDFIEALAHPDIRIIEITNDLNMGANYVSNQLEMQGKSLNDYRSVYRRHGHTPLLHPTLIEHGVGIIRLVLKNQLTIFSKNGYSISHSAFLIDGSHDIVIRNLRLNGLWEWDELDQGQYKRNDWDYFTIEKSSNIWIDHMTFEQAYDGIIDIKEQVSNVTLSWSNLIFEPTAFIEDQIDYLEQNRSMYPFYDELRNSGATQEDLILHSSFQKKGFNLGNSTDGEGFESITMTFHHLNIKNLQSRMPRIRKGDVHLYHIILDNQDIYEQCIRLSNTNLSFVNQGIITTEDGAVLMEHSIFRYVTTPIRNHQESSFDSKYTGRYKVINSELVTANRTYFGSSTDTFTLWVHDNTHETLSFRLRNHPSIPYTYQLQDIFFLPDLFDRYLVGHGEVNGFDWLNIKILD